MVAGSPVEIIVGTHDFDSQVDGVRLDQLNRRPQGERLSDLVDRVPGPFVVALDGAWGTGKSHFLKLWAGSHERLFGRKGKVIYFDAFAHDWQDEPLLGLTRAIAREISYDDPTVTELGKNALRWGLRLTSAFALGAVKALPGGSALGAGAAAAVETVGEITDEALQGLWRNEMQREEAIEDFRADLKKLAETYGKLIIVIDELDRCRPDFALALLEVAKHAFAVPGVVFVLGVNMEALGHSVTKRYGAGVDADLYLQKFVGLAYRLPNITSSKEDVWELHLNQRCAAAGIDQSLAFEVAELLELIGPERRLSLRDVDQVVNRLAMMPPSLSSFGKGARTIALSGAIASALFPVLFNRCREQPRHLDSLMSQFARVSKPDDSDRAAFLRTAWEVVFTQDYSQQGLNDFSRSYFGISVASKVDLDDILGMTLDVFNPPEPQHS
ncbi:hypothetical protein HOY34_05360 [Xinfangfangia sp. D13-10-4-6]|uniref:KAP family P-loop NTPase fold protein n=1 Tax=Pseudogemmobacter hezensis TaxID=2737662 RepID=UPI0015544399|nr:P-loop NTPase fold protein [Pseudogemmobacter hezensis]NPD14630.1 hypothetical protein [Pseudogemmobacter hezensis]